MTETTTGPEFERVLTGHLACSCPDLLDVTRVAHLSAAIHAEVERWLADEGTREVVGMAVLDAVVFTPPDQPGFADTIATSALAALTDHHRPWERAMAETQATERCLECLPRPIPGYVSAHNLRTPTANGDAS